MKNTFEKGKQMNDGNKAFDSTGQVKTKGLLGRWFWVWAALGAAILGLRLMTGGTTSKTATDDRIKSVTVTPAAPSADSVEELRRKRAEELQRERERQQLELEKEKLRADVAARVAKYRGDVNALVEKYRKMLPLSDAEAAFARAKQGADFIASSDGLCGFKICGKLAAAMAYDWTKGTHRTEDMINPIVDANLVVPIADASKAYEKWTADFRQGLQREEMAFALDLAVRSREFGKSISCFNSADARKMNASVGKLVEEVKRHAERSAFAAVGAAVELALIKSSYKAVKVVVKKIVQAALSGVAKKLVVTASSSVFSWTGVSAILTVGGLAWTAYDIYDVCATMPREMREGVMSAINETRVAIRRTADENLNADRDTCLCSAETRAKELEEMINK